MSPAAENIEAARVRALLVELGEMRDALALNRAARDDLAAAARKAGLAVFRYQSAKCPPATIATKRADLARTRARRDRMAAFCQVMARRIFEIRHALGPHDPR